MADKIESGSKLYTLSERFRRLFSSVGGLKKAFPLPPLSETAVAPKEPKETAVMPKEFPGTVVEPGTLAPRPLDGTAADPSTIKPIPPSRSADGIYGRG